MQSRWYSPTTATFTSRDTWPGNLQTPISLNRYTYAYNNPIRYWDPTGFEPGGGCGHNGVPCPFTAPVEQHSYVSNEEKANLGVPEDVGLFGVSVVERRGNEWTSFPVTLLSSPIRHKIPMGL